MQREVARLAVTEGLFLKENVTFPWKAIGNRLEIPASCRQAALLGLLRSVNLTTQTSTPLRFAQDDTAGSARTQMSSFVQAKPVVSNHELFLQQSIIR